MNYDEYQIEAYKTAIYPKEYRIVYPILGLIGEIGEFLKNPIIDEAGDAFWYFGAACTDLGIYLESIVPNASYYDYFSDAHFRLAEITKKIIRDGISDGKKEELIYWVGNYFSYFLFILYKNKIAPENAMRYNLQKLQSRQQRGVLHGDGDDR